jgi:hypothetical protein
MITLRKVMTKEITFTTFSVAKMEYKNEELTIVPLPNEVVMGNISEEKALKSMIKKYKANVSVFNLTTQNVTYQMDVSDFIKYGEIKVEEPTQQETQPEPHPPINRHAFKIVDES